MAPTVFTPNKTSKHKIVLCKIADFGKEKVVADTGFKNQNSEFNKLIPSCWELDLMLVA